MKQVKAKDLKPGMILDDWDLAPGLGSTVKETKIIERPGYKYSVVKITLENGNVIRPFPAEVTKLNVVEVRRR